MAAFPRRTSPTSPADTADNQAPDGGAPGEPRPIGSSPPNPSVDAASTSSADAPGLSVPTAAPSLAPSAAPSSEPEGPPASMFRGDPRRRHRSGFRGPERAPQIHYKVDAGGPIAAMPAIAPGGDLIVASLSGRILRLSPDGAIVWKTELKERIYSSPLIQGELIVLGSDAHTVTALSAKTGKTRWSLGVDGDGDTAAALGANGSIVIAAGKVIYALRANGGIAWRFMTKRKVYASPAVAEDGTVYAGSQDDHLYAISPRGAPLWERDLGADIDCAAAIGDDGTIYVGTDGGQVFAFSPQGSIRWRAEVTGFVRGGLTITRGGAVLAGTYGPAPRVIALDAKTGAERWSFRLQGTGAPEFGIHGAPLEDLAGNLYFGAQDDRIYALDGTGTLLWSFDTGGDVDAPLVVGPGGVLYAGSYDGHIYALR